MRPAVIASAAFASLAAFAPLWAHHSILANYDEKKSVTLKGTVVRYDWSNPHAYVLVDVAGKSGDPVSWAVELDSTIEMKRAGWTRDSIKVGDAVTVEGSPARDGAKEVWAKSITVGNKKLMASAPAASAPPKTGKATPKWPDGHVRLGPEPGQTGYWAYPSATSLVENGVNVRFNADGLLANIADAGKVAPFQPWAKGLYEYRQKSFLKDDPMSSCLPPGGPRQFQTPNGISVYEEPARKRLFVMSGGGNRNWRLINMDGRALPDVENETPTYYGFTTAKWEGDAVVVQTVGFNERFWFSNGGLPHTESLKLTEKLSRPDFDTLRYEVTVNDVGAYTRPWTSAWTLRWVAGQEIPEYFCDDYNREQFRAFEK